MQKKIRKKGSEGSIEGWRRNRNKLNGQQHCCFTDTRWILNEELCTSRISYRKFILRHSGKLSNNLAFYFHKLTAIN